MASKTILKSRQVKFYVETDRELSQQIDKLENGEFTERTKEMWREELKKKEMK